MCVCVCVCVCVCDQEQKILLFPLNQTKHSDYPCLFKKEFCTLASGIQGAEQKFLMQHDRNDWASSYHDAWHTTGIQRV